jgi:hypothetical protein
MGDRQCPVCHETVSGFDQDMGLIFFQRRREVCQIEVCGFIMEVCTEEFVSSFSLP